MKGEWQRGILVYRSRVDERENNARGLVAGRCVGK